MRPAAADRWYVIDSLDDMHPVEIEVRGGESEWPDQVLDHWLVHLASRDHLDSGGLFTVVRVRPDEGRPALLQSDVLYRPPGRAGLIFSRIMREPA